MRKFGLIGRHLGHSFSPTYFRGKFEDAGITDASYDAVELDRLTDESFTALKASGLSGFNVTTPYKEEIIPFLDKLDANAEELGAVNTVKVVNGISKGYNTDIYGFEQSLSKYRSFLDGGNALILGTGGASKAVAFVLNKWGISFRFISRKPYFLQYEDIDEKLMNEVSLIVNTTPLGMYPDVDSFPRIPYNLIGKNHLAFDLIYNPEKSLFLVKAEQNSAKIQNGYEMLVYQAEKAWEIWNKD